jgi:hypothetical protein
MFNKNLENLTEAKLELAKLMAEKDPNKKVTIYPLTKEGKLTEITPFTVSADTSSDTVARMLRKKGITTGNWYGADEGENLPSKYL